MENNKKVAFVTGGTRGIGKSIVEKLGLDGYIVGFNYVNSDIQANELEKDLLSKGIESFSVKFDVSNYEETEKAFSEIYEKYGHIDVLVNNAGITRDKLFIRMKENDFDDVIDINLKGVFNCTKQVVRKMTKQKYGRIINMSSLAGLVGNIGQVNYSASKAGVVGMTKTLAAELGAYGITVNAIAPGFIKTDMTDALSDKIQEKIIESVPMKSVGLPEDISNMVSYLAGDYGRYITGQVISIDGGLSSI
ncbi:3-oxoacyl-[acyl-carrier-protein] reductase [Peptostreptococcus faecalis]|uniref:3-oxoacyl-[acyl-carrier-protein] reductase n=1 Tax=Peptostreptococcus faecalis TaxID=2045015 RepID=UPI000C7E1C30|nr:3-oxoacyl-[acyl-carrier-protein] reductase [Peptostreptococcus faecalis]